MIAKLTAAFACVGWTDEQTFADLGAAMDNVGANWRHSQYRQFQPLGATYVRQEFPGLQSQDDQDDDQDDDALLFFFSPAAAPADERVPLLLDVDE